MRNRIIVLLVALLSFGAISTTPALSVRPSPIIKAKMGKKTLYNGQATRLVVRYTNQTRKTRKVFSIIHVSEHLRMNPQVRGYYDDTWVIDVRLHPGESYTVRPLVRARNNAIHNWSESVRIDAGFSNLVVKRTKILRVQTLRWWSGW